MKYCLALALGCLCFSAVSFGAEKIFVVYSGDTTQEVLTGDVSRMDGSIASLQSLMTSLKAPAEVVPLKLNKISELGPLLDAQLAPSDVIRGFIFGGHGSPVSFSLDRSSTFSAEALTSVIVDAVRGRPHSKSFFLHMWGCAMAKKIKSQKNFLAELTGNLVKRMSSGDFTVDELSLSAHYFLVTRANTLKKGSWVEKLYYRSGLSNSVDTLRWFAYTLPKPREIQDQIGQILPPALYNVAVTTGAILAMLMGPVHLWTLFTVVPAAMVLTDALTLRIENVNSLFVREIEVRNGDVDLDKTTTFRGVLEKNFACGAALEMI